MRISQISISIVLLILLSTVSGKVHRGVISTHVEHKTVVESNHFFSNYQLNTTYEISNVQKGKPLVLLLKQKDSSKESQLNGNPITFTLISGGKTQECVFNSYSNICSLSKIEESNMKLKLKCEKLPCQMSWIIYQPGIIENDGKHDIERLVEVNDDSHHAILEVSCNKPDLKTFSTDMQLFTNSKYNKVEGPESIYYMFCNQKKGYYYLTSNSQAAKSCAIVSIKHSPGSIEFNKKDNIMEDFVQTDQFNTYSFKDTPSSDFRIDCSIHDPVGTKLNNSSGIIFRLTGKKTSGGERVTVVQYEVTAENDKKFIDFSLAFKKTSAQYTDLKFEAKSKGIRLILNANFISSDRQEIELGQNSYFNLKKGEKIDYKIIPEPDEPSTTKQTHIFVEKQKVKSSKDKCNLKTGCQFTIQAVEDYSGKLYIGAEEGKNQKQTIYFDFETSITKKLRDGEVLNLKRKLVAKQSFQVVVNSPSVIVYAANRAHCPQITDKCYEKVINSQNPAIVQVTADGEQIFQVTALDNCELTLTIIKTGDEFVDLMDGVPFAYLFDDRQTQIYFKFKIPAKQTTNFNLIGPTNELNLIVVNANKFKDDETAQTSTDGYVSFPKKEIDELVFIIKVQKMENYAKKYIHFTLIASTKFGNIRLEPGVSHYETIKSKDSRDLVLQFQPKKTFLLNFYCHNLNEDIDLSMKVSKSDNFDKEFQQFIIDDPLDVLDLQDVSKSLCKGLEGQNCQIFIRIKNNMEVQVDFTVTLMIQDAIIELKDGVWQYFSNNDKNTIASSSHFYFLPKHQNKSVTLLYRSSFIDLRLAYVLWKTDDKSINPAEWPFPHQLAQASKQITAYKPTQNVLIGAQKLNECWPNCVILLTLIQDSANKVSKELSQYQSFSIMASNNFIQIPEKTKIDIALTKDQEKHLLIDLKYVMDKTALTFFTNLFIGSLTFTGNIYSQNDPRCPLADQPSDFAFGNVETQISVGTIKKKLEEKSMEDDKNLYICILVRPYLDSKFSIQYTSDDEIIKQLTVDSFETTLIKEKSNTIYQIDASIQYYMKIARNSGFPFVFTKLCTKQDNIEQCLDQFKQNKEKGDQLVQKMTDIYQKPCQKCIMFLKISSEEASEVTIHLQSKFAETDLTENHMVTDSLAKDQENKYSITAIKNQAVIINVQITQGDISVQVSDFQSINVVKTNQKGSKVIHMTIPVQKSTKESQKTNVFALLGYLGAYDLSSTFTSLHVTIKSVDKDKTALYTITYSSGQAEVYLQDGMITQYGIAAGTKTKFMYRNPIMSSIYLHISTETPEALSKMQTKIFSIANQNDEDTTVEMSPQKPNFKKKTPNPTILMTLPAELNYLIQITNNNKDYQLVSLGINNRQVIFLPLMHQFPLQLSQGEHIYLILNTNIPGYIRVTINKCDESNPLISYTLSHDDFVVQEFEYETELADQMVSDIIIKIKKAGNVYLKIKSPDNDKSLLVVNAVYSFDKFKDIKIKPGEKGLIEYQLLNSQKVDLIFTPVVCSSSGEKNCHKGFEYSALSSQKIQNVYAQLVCPAVKFDLEDIKVLSPAKTIPIPSVSSSSSGEKIHFSMDISRQISFIGIKAFNSKTGQSVFYRPIEVTTLWGQITKGSQSNFFVVAMIVLFSLCCALILVRRWCKNINDPNSSNGVYRGLNSVDDD